MNQSIEETIRRSQQITRRYEQFKKDHEVYVIQAKKVHILVTQTEQKLTNTLNLVSETLTTVQNTKDKYDGMQKAWDNIIDKLADQVGQQMGLANSNIVAEFGTPPQIAQIIKESKRIFILTGAGISAASGIRTFRGTGGYWNSGDDEEDPKRILTLNYFETHPNNCWKWLIDFYKLKLEAKPNIAHYSLNKLIDCCLKTGIDVTLVTQNIDNLHVEARQQSLITKQLQKLNIDQKSKNIIKTGKLTYYQIHGNITKLRCQKCSIQQGKLVCFNTNLLSQSTSTYQPTGCKICSEKLRPHIMFFDQNYNESLHHYDSVLNQLDQSDLLIVVGTMLQTGLANGIVSKSVNKGIHIIEMNIKQEIERGNTKCLLGKAQQMIPQVLIQFQKILDPQYQTQKKVQKSLTSNKKSKSMPKKK